MKVEYYDVPCNHNDPRSSCRSCAREEVEKLKTENETAISLLDFKRGCLRRAIAERKTAEHERDEANEKFLYAEEWRRIWKGQFKMAEAALGKAEKTIANSLSVFEYVGWEAAEAFLKEHCVEAHAAAKDGGETDG